VNNILIKSANKQEERQKNGNIKIHIQLKSYMNLLKIDYLILKFEN